MDFSKSKPLVGIVTTVASLLLIAGILTFAAPCGVHDDGTVSACFWAGRATLGIGIVLLILSVVRIFEMDEGERRGLSLAIGLLGALVACVPGVLIDLCTMATMRCHTIMRPFMLAIGVIIALVGLGDLAKRLLALRK